MCLSSLARVKADAATDIDEQVCAHTCLRACVRAWMHACARMRCFGANLRCFCVVVATGRLGGWLARRWWDSGAAPRRTVLETAMHSFAACLSARAASTPSYTSNRTSNGTHADSSFARANMIKPLRFRDQFLDMTPKHMSMSMDVAHAHARVTNQAVSIAPGMLRALQF